MKFSMFPINYEKGVRPNLASDNSLEVAALHYTASGFRSIRDDAALCVAKYFKRKSEDNKKEMTNALRQNRDPVISYGSAPIVIGHRGEIVCIGDVSEIYWHVGTPTLKQRNAELDAIATRTGLNGNYWSLGIEMCDIIHEGKVKIPFDTLSTSIRLAAMMGLRDIFFHKHFSLKDCPKGFGPTHYRIINKIFLAYRNTNKEVINHFCTIIKDFSCRNGLLARTVNKDLLLCLPDLTDNCKEMLIKMKGCFYDK